MNDLPLHQKKVAVLVETEFIHDEIEYYKRRIPELGGELHLLSYLWGHPSMDFVNDIDSPDRKVTDVHRLTVDRCVTTHDPNDYAIVICAANYVAVRLREIPPKGSLGTPNAIGDAPAVRFFAQAMASHHIIKGAMCHALWLLTPHPELLRGRRVICHSVILADVINAGAVFIPDPSHVVVDDDLVTARSFEDVEAYFNELVRAAERKRD
jgi:deglycase